MNYKTMRTHLRAALRKLLNADRDLLEIKVFEKALTHRLGYWLQLQIKGWDVDCEYNKLGDQFNKRVPYDQGRLVSFGKNLNGLVYPDVIVHKRRNAMKNLAVVEAKWHGSADIDFDKYKLSLYRQPDLNYAFAFSVVFKHGQGCPLEAVVSCVEHDESVSDTFTVTIKRGV